MAVTDTTNTVQEAGNGSKTVFTFDFKAFQASDLKVFEVDQTTLVATELTITTHYTVSLNTITEGGTITYVTAPASGKDSFIKRELAFTQATDVDTEGSIPADSLNNEYDRSRMIDIQLKETLDRALTFAETSALSGVVFPEGPDAATRALTIPAWDSAGTALELITVSSVVNTDPIAVKGDIVQGGTAGVTEKLAIGSTNDILQVIAGKAAWVTNPTLLLPTIADLTNMTHDHTDAAGGGVLTGMAVQVVSTQTGAVATTTTTVPLDDTIPQSSEGAEFMTLAITPTSATNKLRIDAVVFASTGSATRAIQVALFQDSTAGALAAIASTQSQATGANAIPLTHFMTSGTTSSTTFKVRIGVDTSGTLTFNGVSSGRIYGGVAVSSITITEIQV